MKKSWKIKPGFAYRTGKIKLWVIEYKKKRLRFSFFNKKNCLKSLKLFVKALL